MRINWMKFAETMSACNPHGPVIMSDGSVYSPDGRLLVGADETVDRQASPRDTRSAAATRRRPHATGHAVRRRLTARGSLRSGAAPAGTR
jgi:hypothetical protein